MLTPVTLETLPSCDLAFHVRQAHVYKAAGDGRSVQVTVDAPSSALFVYSNAANTSIDDCLTYGSRGVGRGGVHSVVDVCHLNTFRMYHYILMTPRVQ